MNWWLKKSPCVACFSSVLCLLGGGFMLTSQPVVITMQSDDSITTWTQLTLVLWPSHLLLIFHCSVTFEMNDSLVCAGFDESNERAFFTVAISLEPNICMLRFNVLQSCHPTSRALVKLVVWKSVSVCMPQLKHVCCKQSTPQGTELTAQGSDVIALRYTNMQMRINL